jgi:hypothetical protein
MSLGRIVFDCSLSLDITRIAFTRGVIAVSAHGKVTTVPSGTVPYAIYGEDKSLILAGRCDFDSLLAGNRVQKGDTISMTHDLFVDVTGVAKGK